MQIPLTLAALSSAAIIFIGARFIASPRVAMLGFGIAPESLRGLTQIKGIRDIVSGVNLLVVWYVGGPRVLGWVLVAAALTPLGDAGVVLANGGKASVAFGVHGLTALLLVGTGLALARA